MTHARRLRALAAIGLVAIFVVACGGGTPAASTASGGSAAPGQTAAGGGDGGGGGGSSAVGEPIDREVVEAAADVLAATDSYIYEMTIIQKRSSDIRTQNVDGVVRTKPVKARSVSYESGGDTIVLMYVDGKDFADFGNGLGPVGDDQGTREETDQLAVGAMYGAFRGQSRDWVVKAKETVHDTPSVHLVLTDEALTDLRQGMGAGYEAWTADLWLAEADGRLVKGIWGGPLVTVPPNTLQPLFTVDITDVDCDCPVIAPS